MTNIENEKQLVVKAVSGNQDALEAILTGVKDMVFNLSLRMLGTIPDAEDATQEILIKIMTHLSSFRHDSSLSTWAFSIAVNHLKSYRKGLFSNHPLSFEEYGEDIISGRERDIPDMTGGTDKALLEHELKLSCTNVMLQCLDAESRCIYILGTMFRLNSQIAADILNMSPEAYRKRLSRIRKKVADFLGQYCGLSGSDKCACSRRTNYAIASHRINPASLDYQSMKKCSYNDITAFTDSMEHLDELSQIFSELPAYTAPEKVTLWLKNLINSEEFASVLNFEEERE